MKDRLLLLLLIAAPAVGSPSREEFVVEQVMHQSQPIAERIQSKSSVKAIFPESYLQEKTIQHSISNISALELRVGMGLVSMDVEQQMVKYFRKELSRPHIELFPLEQLFA